MLYVIYAFVSIFIVNFLFGFVLDKILWKTVPGPADPVHMKMAAVVIVVVLVLTLIWRKAMYIEFHSSDNNVEEENDTEEVIEKEEVMVESEVVEETTVETSEEENVEDVKKEEELEIFINKEKR